MDTLYFCERRPMNTAISFSALSFYKSTDQKPFLTDHAITCGVNGLTSFIWCNKWSGLPAHLSTRLKGATSSFRATGDIILSVPHVAATALLHKNSSQRRKSAFPTYVKGMWDQWDTLTNSNLGKQHLPVITFFSFSHCGTDILVRCFICVFVADNNCSDVWIGKTWFYWFSVKKVRSVSFQFWLVTKKLKWKSHILWERMTTADCTGRIMM